MVFMLGIPGGRPELGSQGLRKGGPGTPLLPPDLPPSVCINPRDRIIPNAKKQQADSQTHSYIDGIHELYARRTLSFAHPATLLDFRATILPQRLQQITSISLDGALNAMSDAEWPRHLPGDWDCPVSALGRLHRRDYGASTLRPASSSSWPADRFWPAVATVSGPPRRHPAYSTWRAMSAVLAGMAGLRRLRICMSWRRFAALGELLAEDEVFGPLAAIRQPGVFDVVVDWAETEAFPAGPLPFRLTRIASFHPGGLLEGRGQDEAFPLLDRTRAVSS
jgi:hypothetical protein